jgi:hypothetical protein
MVMEPFDAAQGKLRDRNIWGGSYPTTPALAQRARGLKASFTASPSRLKENNKTDMVITGNSSK